MKCLAKLFLSALFLSWGTFVVSCREESAEKSQPVQQPELAELIQSIDKIEQERLRGNTLTSLSVETKAELERVMTRSKVAAIGLADEPQSLPWLTELVRARDQMLNIELLVQDLDFVGVFRDRLVRAVDVFLVQQNRVDHELADPNVERMVFDQRFTLKNGLGAFYSFIESKTSSGPRMFEGRSFQLGNNTIENVSTRLDQNQAIWLLSPRISLTDARELRLIVRGAVDGAIVKDNFRGFRVFVSEAFDGRFTSIEESGWQEITQEATRLPSSNKKDGDFSNFTSEFYFNQYRGKTVVIGLRMQGAESVPADFQFRQISIRGKGFTNPVGYQLIAPAPLELTPSNSRPDDGDGKGRPDKKPDTDPTPNPGTPVVSPLSKLPKCNLLPEAGTGLINLTEFCHIAFDSAASIQSLVQYNGEVPNPNSLFTKFNLRQGQFVSSAPLGGWKNQTDCTIGRPADLKQESICAQRFASTAFDLLIGPAIKLPEGSRIKIYSTLTGYTRNAPATEGSPQTNRFRIMLLPAVTERVVHDKAESRFYLEKAASNERVPFDPISNFDFDAIINDYPVDVLVPVATPHTNLTVSMATVTRATANYNRAVHIALILNNTLPRPIKDSEDSKANNSAWFVHEIAIERGE